MSAPRSICLLRLSAIGDTCNAAAVVHAIRQYYPDTEITWVIGKAEAALMAGMDDVNFVVFDKKQGLAAYRNLRHQLQGKRYDALLLMQVALRANLASLCISAKRRIGYDKAKSKELHSLFINERIEPTDKVHVLDNFRQFQESLGVPLEAPAWNIPVNAEDRDWAIAQLDPGTRKHLIITPAASNAERNWLPDRYAAVADYAASKGFSVYLCGGPADHEKELAASIQAHARHSLHNLVGQSNLKQLFALIGEASLVLAPDTGPAHMAVAAGTPVIGLYAHSNPKRTGPYLWQNYVVDAYTPALKQMRGETPEQSRWGQRLKGEELMENISTEQVIEMLSCCIQEQNL
ncbi:glycosyltransferase family 9 protein [Marinobacter sp. NSM]|uniref:glycosyltransferase family 9 protein n=1 Tax=Marinobacter sp. NSM TaxID=3458004 RepID=UPI004036D9E5